jgi:hypothetical protein
LIRGSSWFKSIYEYYSEYIIYIKHLKNDCKRVVSLNFTDVDRSLNGGVTYFDDLIVFNIIIGLEIGLERISVVSNAGSACSAQVFAHTRVVRED